MKNIPPQTIGDWANEPNVYRSVLAVDIYENPGDETNFGKSLERSTDSWKILDTYLPKLEEKPADPPAPPPIPYDVHRREENGHLRLIFNTEWDKTFVPQLAALKFIQVPGNKMRLQATTHLGGNPRTQDDCWEFTKRPELIFSVHEYHGKRRIAFKLSMVRVGDAARTPYAAYWCWEY